MQRKLLGIISVDFEVIVQILIIYSTFVQYLRKNGNTMKQCISYLQTSRKLKIQLGGKSCMILLNLVKGKAIPLQAWSGPEGSRKLRFPDFMTTAQDGSKVASLRHRLPLPPGNAPGIHFC